jgi:predicted ATPase
VALSSDVRRLYNKWAANTGWPKRLDSLEIGGMRGWSDQKVEFKFPIVAIVGENGAGKSTILQCAASVYQPPENAPIEERGYYPTDFLPDTRWDNLKGASIGYTVRQGDQALTDGMKKLQRWRGYSKRPRRHVHYIDLSRVQPIAERVGYFRLANPQLQEASASAWDDKRVAALSHIMGRTYEGARLAITSGDAKRGIPILRTSGIENSGFHHGAGELTMEDFLQVDFRSTSLVLIDEIETSLHPRVQRRLMRWLAERARQLDLQILMTTHSPYILSELPPEARIYIMNTSPQKTVVTGISPEFAMSQMDDENYPECDVYVEDDRSGDLVKEILVKFGPSIVQRCEFTPYGAASAGFVLGKMDHEKRFKRPTRVFVDGDQDARPGCIVLPGDEAPERVVFGGLKDKIWSDLSARLSRDYSVLADACNQAMTFDDHHEWVRLAANKLLVSGDLLWQQMCAAWVASCLDQDEAAKVTQPIHDALSGI